MGTRTTLALALAIVAGCTSGGSPGTCSSSLAQCSGAEFSFCESGVVKKITCKGPNACANGVCDTSTHTVGDGCTGSLFRCDPANGSQVLQCAGTVLKAHRTCSGPRQCFTENNTVGCEVTIGDSCPAAFDNRYFCDSVDSTQVLRCADGGVGFYSKCSGVKSCALVDGGLVCR